MSSLLKIFTFSAVNLLLTACDLEQPKTFDDCLLSGMKGVTSDVAAKGIQAACFNKFAPIAPKDVALTTEQVRNITGEMSALSSQIIEGTIYNGNRDTTVSTATLKIIALQPGTQKEIWIAEYNVKLGGEPLTSNYVTIHLGRSLEGKSFKWGGAQCGRESEVTPNLSFNRPRNGAPLRSG